MTHEIPLVFERGCPELPGVLARAQAGVCTVSPQRTELPRRHHRFSPQKNSLVVVALFPEDEHYLSSCMW